MTEFEIGVDLAPLCLVIYSLRPPSTGPRDEPQPLPLLPDTVDAGEPQPPTLPLDIAVSSDRWRPHFCSHSLSTC
jgi:hypothetical protein